MGIGNANTELLLAVRAAGVTFGRAATIGKQAFWPEPRALQYILPAFGIQTDPREFKEGIGDDGDCFLRKLGASDVTSFDASGYEGATVVHDMNCPVADVWHDVFDLVYDGGCMEHIFDVKQVVQNLMALVKPGGYLVVSTSGNNLLGHGFYQFSPEFFYRTLCAANGWQIASVMLCEHALIPPRFWAVADPSAVKGRVELHNSQPAYIMVVARKSTAASDFVVPQQSDYSAVWSATRPAGAPPPANSTLVRIPWVKRLRRLKRRFWPAKKGFGQSCYRKLSLADLAAGRLSWHAP